MPADEVLGRSFHDVLPPEAATVAQAAIQAASEKGVARDFQYSLDLPDGKRWFEFSVARKVLAEDVQAHFVVLSRDISELRRRDRLLLSKDATIREIHHRVKNNFQLIISMFRLRSRRANPEERARLDEIARSIGVMAAIQEELLHHPNASRIEFGTYLRNLLDGYRTLADGRIDVDDSGIGQVDIPVGNAVPLALAANEALSNAFNHAFPGGRRGRLRMTLGEDPRDGFILVIEDDGVGFDTGRTPSGGMGMEIMRALAGQASAGLDVVSQAGTRVVIRGREAA